MRGLIIGAGLRAPSFKHKNEVGFLPTNLKKFHFGYNYYDPQHRRTRLFIIDVLLFPLREFVFKTLGARRK